MPKNNNNSRSKSERKPLNDISNGGKSSKLPTKKKIYEEKEEEDDSLDRLLLAHSDLSNVIQQIDELVIQARKVKMTSKKGRKEIESFTNVLSDMQSSLKTWIPRFRKSLSSPSMVSETQLDSSKTVHTANEEISNNADSPVLLDSLVSPSPLVSWCADRTVESGRQLFLLTPLPISKELTSKRRGLSRSVFQRKMDVPPDNTTFEPPSLMNISENSSDDLLEGVEIKPTPNNFSASSSVHEMKSTFELGFVSPSKFVTRDHSMFLMTPRLKMSPPKSCVLLEPISESFQQNYNDIPKSTQFHDGTENHSSSHSSEPSSSSISANLVLKYPELFGLHQTHRSRVGRNEIEEASLGCYRSPPKSCILMEPPDENLLLNLTTNGDLLTKKACNRELVCESKARFESTPLWNVCESTIRTGKRPGETTLKRELWTKFEAVSSNVLSFVFQETASKGFLDRLEEASCEESSSVPDGLR